MAAITTEENSKLAEIIRYFYGFWTKFLVLFSIFAIL